MEEDGKEDGSSVASSCDSNTSPECHDQDKLYGEFCGVKEIVKKLEKEKKFVSDIWSKVFKKLSAADFSNMKKRITSL
ncbi:UNVERIFIED_CONTAM: hypothetical protein FKN15_049024 [Acipenser sinensis]